jgi:hypothetical protein
MKPLREISLITKERNYLTLPGTNSIRIIHFHKYSVMSKSNKTTFIVSNSKKPAITLKPGQKIQVTSVQLVDPSLKKAKKGAARLCGGTSTCIALIDISDTEK